MSELTDRFGDSYCDDIDASQIGDLLASMQRFSSRDASCVYGSRVGERPRDEVSCFYLPLHFVRILLTI